MAYPPQLHFFHRMSGLDCDETATFSAWSSLFVSESPFFFFLLHVYFLSPVRYYILSFFF